MSDPKEDLTHQFYARTLLATADLSKKERKFCEGMANIVTMTERQEQWLLAIWERLQVE